MTRTVSPPLLYALAATVSASMLFAVVVAVVPGFPPIPPDPAEAHEYADAVLMPEFVAAFNEWTRLHPTDRPGHPYEHCERLDAGDVARWKTVREAFRQLERAYKRSSY